MLRIASRFYLYIIIGVLLGLPSKASSKGWDARDITLPHYQVDSLYVANPDHVLSEGAEAAVNHIMYRMDKDLGIESAVVVVNHVKDKDIFRFAQDLFDIHKIGKDDRGLVIVLAYEDHLIRTHTGRSLEGDLPDILCSRLQNDNAIPGMKAGNPDKGMIDLTRAIYYTLKNEEMPSGTIDPLLSTSPAYSSFSQTRYLLNNTLPRVLWLILYEVLFPILFFFIGWGIKSLLSYYFDDKISLNWIRGLIIICLGAVAFVAKSHFPSYIIESEILIIYWLLFSFGLFCSKELLERMSDNGSSDRGGDGGGGYSGGSPGGGGATSSW